MGPDTTNHRTEPDELAELVLGSKNTLSTYGMNRERMLNYLTRLARAETNPQALQEEQQQPVPDNSEEVETTQYRCDVCLCDDFTEDEITKLDVCEHYLCTVCMKNTIKDNIDNGRWEMTCHHRGGGQDIEPCARLITDAEVRRIAAPERYSVYQTKVRELVLERRGAIRCPNPAFPEGCTNWVYPQVGTTRRQCLFCDYAFCADTACRVAVDDSSESERKMQDERPENVTIVTRYANWCPSEEHFGLTCEQFQLTGAVQGNGDCKQCPGLINGQGQCPALLSHDQGCNHMTCRTCRHEFCWTCRKPTTQDEVNSEGGYVGCHSSYCMTENIRTGLNF